MISQTEKAPKECKTRMESYGWGILRFLVRFAFCVSVDGKMTREIFFEGMHFCVLISMNFSIQSKRQNSGDFAAKGK